MAVHDTMALASVARIADAWRTVNVRDLAMVQAMSAVGVDMCLNYTFLQVTATAGSAASMLACDARVRVQGTVPQLVLSAMSCTGGEALRSAGRECLQYAKMPCQHIQLCCAESDSDAPATPPPRTRRAWVEATDGRWMREEQRPRARPVEVARHAMALARRVLRKVLSGD